MARSSLVPRHCRRRAKRWRCIFWTISIRKWTRCARPWNPNAGPTVGAGAILRCDARCCLRRDISKAVERPVSRRRARRKARAARRRGRTPRKWRGRFEWREATELVYVSSYITVKPVTEEAAEKVNCFASGVKTPDGKTAVTPELKLRPPKLLDFSANCEIHE